MDISQRNYLLIKTIVIDKNFGRVSHKQTHQDMMRIINELIMELHTTQRELKELKDKIDIL